MLITVIIWAAVIQGLLLGVIFISSRKHKSFANKLLGSFLIAFVFVALTALLPIDKIGNYSIEGYFTLPEVKMLLPLLFLHFVLEKVGRSSHYHRFLKFHYVIAFVTISLSFVNVLLWVLAQDTFLGLLGWPLMERSYMSYQYYAFLLSVVALGIALFETRRYRNLVRNEYTDLAMLDINWLWQYLFGIAPIILFWGAELLRIALGGTGQSELTTIVYIFIALFNYFVSYKAFTHQTLFDGTAELKGAFDAKLSTSIKPEAPVDQDICTKIKRAMEIKEFYLNQHLTIHVFAREIEISARTISSCINQNEGHNFNEWVNNYRVDKALEFLNDTKSSHLSIEGIGIDSGFSSRSAMYSAFSKKLGKSPGHYR